MSPFPRPAVMLVAWASLAARPDAGPAPLQSGRGAITGRVLDVDGLPVPQGLTVELIRSSRALEPWMPPPDVPACKGPLPWCPTRRALEKMGELADRPPERVVDRATRTGAQGRFELDGLPDGNYFVWSMGQDPWLAVEEVEVRAGARVETVLRAQTARKQRGVIQGPGGVPIAGSRVVRIASPVGARVEAESGPDGRYELPNFGHSDFVVVTAPGFAPAVHLGLSARTIELRREIRAGTIRGVVTHRGRPIPRAEVGLVSGLASVLADAGGRFQIDGVLESREPYVLEARQGRRVGYDTVELHAGDVVEVNLRLTFETRPLEISVVDAQGEPVSGVTVWLNPMERQFPFYGVDGEPKTDAKGKVRFPAVPLGAFRLWIAARAYDELQRDLTISAGTTPQKLKIRLPGGGVRGVVVDPEGRAVAHAEVHGELMGREAPITRRSRMTNAGSDGRFELLGLHPGRWRFVASKPGELAPAAAEADIRGKEAAEIKIALEHGGEIRGRVLDGAGRPLAGWVVHAIPKVAADLTLASVEVVSGHDGAFVLRGLSSGEIPLTARRPREDDSEGKPAPALRSSGQVTARVGDRDVIIRVGARGQILGLVRFKGAQAPDKFSVQLGRSLPRDFDAQAGAFTLEPDETGRLELSVSAAGFRSATRIVDLAMGARLELDIELEAGLTLEGQVIDMDGGRPIVGALVRVPPRTPDLFRDAPRHEAITAPDGRFSIAALPPGEYAVEVLARGFAKAVSSVVPLSRSSPPAAPLVVTIGRGVSAAGVLWRDGKPEGAASLELHRASGPRSRPVAQGPSASDGAFRFESVPPGDYVLTANISRNLLEPDVNHAKVTVPKNGVTDLVVRLRGGTSVLVVRVPKSYPSEADLHLMDCALDLQPAANWDLLHQDACTRWIAKGVDNAVEVAFGELAPGKYTLVVEDPDSGSFDSAKPREPKTLHAQHVVIPDRGARVEIELPTR